MNRARKLFGSPTGNTSCREGKVSISPSTNSKANKRGATPASDLEALQIELNKLRKQHSETELLRRNLTVQEEENQRKDKELRNLNDKFHEIHKGLLEVEEERQRLRQSKQQLEDEKKKIQLQLDVREKEVLSLVRRCSAQEDKVKEAIKLRASHGDLSNQVEDLRTSLNARNREILQVEKLQQDLTECQASKQELQIRLSKLKKEHDDIADTLNSCFSNIQKMADSHREREEDRRREQQRAELDLEKQRLAHLDATADLRYALENRQARIEQMEVILKENMATSTGLRKERAEANKINEAVQLAQKLDYEKQIADLQENHEIALTNSSGEFEALLEKVYVDLRDKDVLVSSLEEEVSICMQKMMNMSSELQRLQDERETEQDNHEKVLSLIKGEMHSLKELVTTKDLDLTVLNAKLSELECENSELKQRLSNVSLRCTELEKENAFIMDLEEQLLEVHYEVVETEEEQIMAAEEHSIAMERLINENENQRMMWSGMEKGLVERVNSLERERSEVAEELKRYKFASKTSIADLEIRLKRSNDLANSLNSTVDILRKAVNEKDGQVVDLNATLEEERCKNIEYDGIMATLQSELEDLRAGSCTQKVLIQTTLAEKSQMTERLEEEIITERGLVAENVEKCLNLQRELDTVRSLARRDLDDLNSVIQEKDNTSRSLLLELDSIRIKSLDREQCLQELEAELSFLRSDNNRVLGESTLLVKEKEEVIVALTSELRITKDDLARQNEAYSAEIVSKDSSVQRLEAALADQTLALEQLKLSNLAISFQVQATSEELVSEKKKFEEVESRLQYADSALAQLQLGSQSTASQLSVTIQKQEEQIQHLVDELFSLRAASGKDGENLQALVASKDEEILSLNLSLDERQASFERIMLSQQVTQSEKNIDIASLKGEIEELRAQKMREDQQRSTLLQDKENQITSLRNELKNSRDAFLELNDTTQKEIRGLTSKLLRLNSDLTIAEDEIRDLKLIELKEAEETISSLEDELKVLRQTTNVVNRNAADATAELEGQVTQLRTRTTSLERLLRDTTHMHDKTVEKMQTELATLKDDNNRLVDELQERFEKLQERHSTIASLTSQKVQLEASERRMIADVERLRASEEKLKVDYDIVVQALEREFQKQQTNREDFDLERQKHQAALCKEVADAELKIDSQREQMANLECVISDRSRLLADMVSHNKDTEEELSKAHLRLADLELIVDTYRIEKENARTEIEHLVIQLQRKEDQLLDALQDERHRREILESDLESVIASAKLVKSDNKELEELEKENQTLKDKVRRQEAYLKRKLEKDKILRDRVIPCDKVEKEKVLRDRSVPRDIFKERPVTTIKNIMSTPSRIKIPSKITTPARSKIPSPSKREPEPGYHR